MNETAKNNFIHIYISELQKRTRNYSFFANSII